MTFTGFRCDSCGTEVALNPKLPVLPGWIAVERRGSLLSISSTLYTCETYKHFCPKCAEEGIAP